MRPLLGWRGWTPIATEKVRDVSFGRPGTMRTYALYARKGKTKTRYMDGWWTVEQLRGDRGT